ncbi:MAG: hypothetical protein WCC10_06845 [Tumebacillaceae bacterium]
MMTTIYRVLRLISLVTGLLYGLQELRSMYVKRKHMWGILRRLVRQLG